MPSRNRIPDLLEPYLQLPPKTSLILLTETLTCNISWLTARFVRSLLSSVSEENKDSAVLFVSWTRDETFWRNEIRRTTTSDPTTKSLHFFPLLHLPTIPSSPSPLTDLPSLKSHLTSQISSLTTSNPAREIHLVLDCPSLTLALAPPPSPSTQPSPSTSNSLLSLIHTLRSHPSIHSTIVTLPADLPLLSATHTHLESSAPRSKLDVESAAFLAGIAHTADMVLSVRELETGSARGVSGVLRVTRGGGYRVDGFEEGEVRKWEWEEKELLYLVKRDGGVKVGGRGEAGFEE